MLDISSGLDNGEQQLKQNYDKFIQELSNLEFKSYGSNLSNTSYEQIKKDNINLITKCIIKNFFKDDQGNEELTAVVTKIATEVEKELTKKLTLKHDKIEKQLGIKQVFWKTCAIGSAITSIATLGSTIICAAAFFQVSFAVEAIFQLFMLIMPVPPVGTNFHPNDHALIFGTSDSTGHLAHVQNINQERFERDKISNSRTGGGIFGPILLLASTVSSITWNYTAKWSKNARDNLVEHQQGKYIEKISSKNNKSQNILGLDQAEIKTITLETFENLKKQPKLQDIVSQINSQIHQTTAKNL